MESLLRSGVPGMFSNLQALNPILSFVLSGETTCCFMEWGPVSVLNVVNVVSSISSRTSRNGWGFSDLCYIGQIHSHELEGSFHSL